MFLSLQTSKNSSDETVWGDKITAVRLISHHLTGIWVLSTGVRGLSTGRAVCGGRGGNWNLAAAVWSFTQLGSTSPTRTRWRRVRLIRREGRLRELLRRALLVQLHCLTHCGQTQRHVHRCPQMSTETCPETHVHRDMSTETWPLWTCPHTYLRWTCVFFSHLKWSPLCSGVAAGQGCWEIEASSPFPHPPSQAWCSSARQHNY